MLSVRVTRDRRGYDHIYLVEETRRRGRPEGRLLYWSRLPGGVRVVRDPFDDDTKVRLERANPGVVFDWPSLLKSMQASAAAARWNARQQHGGPPPNGPAGGGHAGGRSRQPGKGGQRRWREDDEGEADDVEGAGGGNRATRASSGASGDGPLGPSSRGGVAGPDEPPAG